MIVLKKRNIILIGFMGSGKSSVAKKLSTISNKNMLDTDTMIVNSSGKSIESLFAVSESHFRSWEYTICNQLIEQDDLIIATGGGIILTEDNRRLLSKLGFVVYLKASVETIYKRTKRSTHRPLLNVPNKKEVINSTLSKRSKLYEQTADLSIEVDNLTIAQIADKINVAYENSRP